MTYIRAWMSLKFGQIRSGTTELAALEHLKQVAQWATIAHLRASKSSKYLNNKLKISLKDDAPRVRPFWAPGV